MRQEQSRRLYFAFRSLPLAFLLVGLCALPFIARSDAPDSKEISDQRSEVSSQSAFSTRYFSRENAYTRILTRAGTTNPFAPLAAVYTWEVGDGLWNTASNWDPDRTTPATDDILVFNTGGAKLVTNVPTETIGQISIGGGAQITLQAATNPATLTISGGVLSLDVASGAQLNVSGSNVLNISLTSGTTGRVIGSMTLTGGAHRLTAASASGITFQSGSTFTQSTGFTGNAFGTTGSPNTIIFASGSIFDHKDGSNPFGLTEPNSKVVFQTGNLYRITASGTSPSFSGRTYANFQYNPGGANSLTASGTSALLIDDLTVTTGTFNYSMTGTPGHAIKGNISVASGATLNFNAGAASTVNLSGTSSQTISGAGTLSTISSFQTISVSNATGVTFQRNVVTSGPFNVVSGGVLNFGTNVISGTGTFNAQPGATLGIGSTDGITTFPSATGNVQNLNRIYNSSANYTYNGTSAQVTGNGVPTTLAGSLTISNTSGVTLSKDLTLNGASSISSGATLNTGAFALTVGNTLTNSGTFNVSSGGTLKGTGTVTGPTTVASGGIVAPGTSPGILNTGDVSFTSGSNFNVEINGTTAGSGYDQLNVTGTVTLGGATLNVTLGFTPASGNTFTIINNDAGDAVSGNFAGLGQGGTFHISGTTFQISYTGGTGNDVVLTVLPPPELSIADVSQAEGNSGTTSMSFTVTRSGDLLGTSTVSYSTTAGTATEGPCSTTGNDYESASGLLTFSPSDDSETITVTICGDTTAEPDETFTVNLSSATNATISDNQATGTIQNDDGSVTYTWTPNSTEALALCAAQANHWTCPGNWTPLRPTATAASTVTTDILNFDGSITPSPTILNVPTQTVAAMQFKNNINEAKFEATLGAATLTVNGNTGSDLSIAAGSAARLQGSNPITIALTAAGQEGIISGNLVFAGAAHKLTGANAGEIVFQSTSIFTTTTGFSGHPFGSGTDGSVIFDGGANSFFGAGSDPFGGTGKTVVSFGLVPLSSQEFSAASAFDSNGRTYGNLTLTGSGQAYGGSGSNPLTVFGNFVLGSNSTLTLSSTSGGDMVVNGNWTDNNTSPTAFTANGRTVKFQGAGTQTISKVGNPVEFFDVLIQKIAGSVKQLTDVTINGALQFGGLAGSAVDVLEINSNLLTLNGTLGSVPNANSGIKGDLLGSNLSITGTGSLGTVHFIPGGESLSALSINRNTLVPFDTDLTIGNTNPGTPQLILTDGIISMISTTLTLESDVVVVRTSTLSGFVIGNLQRRKACSGGPCGTLTFHVGHGDGYSPIEETISVSQAGEYTQTVRAFDDPHPNITGANKLQMYWTLSSISGPGSATADIKFTYLASLVVGNENDYKIFRYNNGFTQFDPDTLDTTDPTFHFATLNGVSQFSDWTLAEAAAVQEGTIQFLGLSVSNFEANGNIPFTVTRSGGSDGAVTVGYNLVDLAATGGGSCTGSTDYINTSGTVTWAAGDNADKTINVPVCDDAVFEGNENFRAELTTPTGGATLGSPSTIIGIIVNDDAAPSFAIDDVTHNEGNSGTTNYTFTVTKTGTTDVNAAVNFTTVDGTATIANSDYTSNSGTLFFLPGDNTKTITVLVNGDTTVEPDEAFTVHLDTPVSATISDADGTGTITNDDTDVSVGITSATSVAEDGVPNLVYRFTRAGVTAGSLTANFSVGGTATFGGPNADYTQSGAATFSSSSGTVTFGNGVSTVDVTIDPNTDSTYEANETVILTVTSGIGYNATGSAATGTITNDDSAPSFAIDDVTHLEDDSGTTNFVFTVTKTGSTDLSSSVDFTTVDGSATLADSDYQTNSGTLNFGPTDTTKQITVLVNGDTTVEPDEAFTVHLSNPIDASVSDADGTGTIQNDDTASDTDVTLSGGNLIITDGNGGTSNDTLTISLVAGPNIRINDPNNTLSCGSGTTQFDANTCDISQSSVTGNIQVNTLAGNDTLTLSLAGGDFIPAGGLSYAGGDPTSGPGDKLIITGGSQGTVTYNYTNASDGNIVMSNFGTVSYTGLEPITNSGTADDIIFNLPAGGTNIVTLADVGGGMSRISSNPVTFEPTDFANPTSSVNINRGTASDTVTINTLAASYANVAIGSAATPFDTVTLNGTVTFAAVKGLSLRAINFASTATGSATSPGAGFITVVADNAAIDPASVLNAGTGIVILAPATASRPINLGTETVGSLSLTDAEIDRITAATLQIGNSSSGAITVSAGIDLTDGPVIATLTLVTGANVTETFAGNDLTVDALNITAPTGIGGIGGQALDLAVTTLKTDSTGSNGHQFLNELDTVNVGPHDLNAGTGTITLYNAPGGRFNTTGVGGDILSDVVVASGATLGGGGSVLSTKTTTVESGGTLSPGASTGTLNTGQVTFNSGSSFDVEINGTTVTTGYDQLNVTGSVTLGGATLNLSGTYTPAPADSFIIINNDGTSDPIPDTFNGLPEGSTVNVNGFPKVITYTGGDGNDVELEAGTCPTSFTVNDNGDAADTSPGNGICATSGAVCTLRASIQEANALTGCGPIDINFSLSTPNTILLGSALPSIVHNININGLGANLLTVSGNNITRIFTTTSSSTVSISGLTLTGGNGGGAIGNTLGGAIYVGGGSMTLDGLHITGNAADVGAGVEFVGGTTHRILNSTFSSNTAISFGGGFDISSGSLLVANSTFSGNSQTSGSGTGGAANISGNVRLVNVTISSNSAVFNGGGLSVGPLGTVTMSNSLIAGNTASIRGEIFNAGTVISAGNNLIGDSPGDASNTFNPITYQSSDILDTPPLLGPLQNNGGPTPTRALLAGSPAIEKGNNCVVDNTCAPPIGFAITTDQRGAGFPRKVGANVDIGAFEVQNTAPVWITTSATVSEPSGTQTNPLQRTATLQVNEADNGQSLTFSLTGGTGYCGASPTHPFTGFGFSPNPVTSAAGDESTNMSFNVGANDAGIHCVRVSVNDGFGDVTQDVEVTVTAANSDPSVAVIDGDDAITVNEPSGTQANTQTDFPLSGSDFDSSQTLVFSIETPPTCMGGTAGFAGASIVNETATPGTSPNPSTVAASLRVTAGPNDAGTYCIRVKVSDGVGGSAFRDVILTIAAANSSPVANNDAHATDENTPLNVIAPGVLGNDTDVDTGQTRTAIEVTGPSHAASFTLNSDGSFNYTPASGYAGPDTFTYKARDDSGDSGTHDSNTATVTITVNATACTPAPAGMVAWLPGDGNAHDISGNGNNGTLSGTTFGPGEVSSAFDFDGVDDNLVVPNSATLSSAANGLTVDAWVYWRGHSSGDGGVDRIHAKRSASGASHQLVIVNGTLHFGVNIGSGGNNASSPGFPTNQWVHVAGTYDETTVRLFLDGVEVASQAVTGPVQFDSGDLAIGWYNSSFGEYFNGLIDEFEVFNRALAAAEVQAIASHVSFGKCRTCIAPPAGVVAWYAGEGNASSLTGTNNGTANGTVNFVPGKVGQGLQTNGGFVRVTNALSLRPSTAVTVDAWVKGTAADVGDDDYIVSKSLTSGVSSYALYSRPGDGIAFYVKPTTGALVESPIATGIWDGNFHHVLGTYDGSFVRLYVDGVEVGTGTAATGTIQYGTTHASGDLLIGDLDTTPGDPSNFNGVIDELEIFNRALSASEAAALANAGNAGKCHTSTVQFSSATYNVAENVGSGNATITVTRTGATNSSVTVDYATVAGGSTATPGTCGDPGVDYVPTSGTLTFVANDVSETFTIAICNDTTLEAVETVNLALNNPTGSASLGTPATAVLNISNLEDQPVITIDDVSIAEGQTGTTNFVFTVTKTGSTELTATVDYATADGFINGATGGVDCTASDYISTSGGLSFAPNETTKTITVQVCGDPTVEPDEIFFVNLSGGANRTLGDAIGDGVIQNDESDITIGVSPSSVFEDSAPSLVFTFTRTFTNGALTVNFSVGGTATFGTNPGDDYTQTGATTFTPPTGTVTFADGSATATVTVNPTTDTTLEPNETVVLTVTAGTGYTIGTTNEATGTITDDDAAATVVVVRETNLHGWVRTASGTASTSFVVGPGTPPLGEGSGQLSVGSNGGSAAQFRQTGFNGTLLSDLTRLRYSTYTSNDGTVPMIGDQTIYIILNVDLDGDGDFDGSDTQLFFEPEYQHGHTNTVPDQGDNVLNTWQTWDALNGGWWSTTGAAGAGTGANVKPLSTIIAAFPNARIHNHATTGSLRLVAGFGAGAWDNFVGNVDDVNVGVSNVNTQYDFEPLPRLSISDVTQSEGNADFTFTVSLSRASDQVMTVNYATADSSAVAPGDYGAVNPAQTLTFDPGETSQQVIINVVDDNVFEAAEQFFVNLSSPVNSAILDGQGVGTITDNDPMPTITINDVTQAEGSSGTTSFSFTVSLSHPSSTNVTVDYDTVPGTTNPATEGACGGGNDYESASGTATISAGNTSTAVVVSVCGELLVEPAETFFVNLSNNSANSIMAAGAKGTGTITNDDTSFSISDVSMAEGTGGTTNFVFIVTKSGDVPADVNFTTVDGSAQDDNPASEDNDYGPNTGPALSFGPTEATKTITVVVNADATPEVHENFTVVLSGASNGATISDDTGVGTILNDDESVAAGQLIISEFRLSGPGANPTERANNEFIELYNNSAQALFVTTTDGSAGWAVATPSGVEVFHVPNGTTIPARGHFLGTNTNGYSLNSYPAGDGNFATGNATWTTDVPDNTALAVFRTNNAANFSTTTRLDAVGPNTESNTLYREGSGYSPLAPADLAQNLEHTFFRQICVFQGDCPTPGRPRDTQDNGADFFFADTIGAATSAGQRLGSPGPENLASPIKRDPAVNLVLLDATVSDGGAPNRDRNTTPDSANASLFGTMTIRRRVVNQTGGPVTRLRFRVIDMSTHPSGLFADLRVRSSSSQVISGINDPNTCASTGTPTTPSCEVNVTGLTLEQPPNVSAANGGGLNTTLTLPLTSALANGDSINVNFRLGVQKTGQFRFYLVIEALP